LILAAIDWLGTIAAAAQDSCMPLDILIFVTWKTWRNRHVLDLQKADELNRMLPNLARAEGATILEMVIIPDHVHAVIRMNGHLGLPSLMQRLKGTSSRLINRDRDDSRRLRWFRGYHAQSIGRRDLPNVRRYFEGQAKKHGYAWQLRFSIEDFRTKPDK
jgi:REP element-mobilizing transposase RayT